MIQRFLRALRFALGGVLLLLAPVAAGGAESLPSPESYFGHAMGADRRLVGYDELLPYYELLAAGSDRVALERIGTSTEGRDLVLLVISTPANLARADRYREIAARLHDPRGLSDADFDSLVAEGKAILMVTLNIHATEIGSSQMGPEWIHALATGGPDSPARFLEDVILLVVPSVNPDGQALVTTWYRDHVDTPYEGCRLPRLYHPYAGHDNNRDWFMLNLAETRAVNHALYHRWYPQVLVDEHQMGPTGPRIFVPPYADPLSEQVHPLIHREAMLIGANMAMDLEQQGKAGAIYGYSFDAYWPGGTRSTPWWKNTAGILTEVASARVASPIFVDPGELTGGKKGLPDYRAQVNFPHPWPGGWWRLRDIVDYELIVSNSALETVARHREDFLRNRAAMARDAVRDGAGRAYVVPPEQRDPGTAARLVEILAENGVDIFRAPRETYAGERRVPAGSWILPAAQPFRAFLDEMMAPQRFPEVRSAPGDGEILAPYDVTAWSLPDLMGVTVFAIDSSLSVPADPATGPFWTEPPLVDGPGDRWALSPAANASYAAVLRLLQAGKTVRRVSVPFRDQGLEWPAGTFLTPAGREDMERALRGLRAQARRVATPPPTDPGASLESGASAEPALRLPRVGVYQSWLAPTDEGWTRYVFDDFGLPYRVLHNEDIGSGRLVRSFDVIVIPSQSRRELVEGTSSRTERRGPPLPAPYDRGLGPEGVAALNAFVREGGTLVTLGRAVELAAEDLDLPVNLLGEAGSLREFSTPGTLVWAEIDVNDPLGYGMPPRAVLYHHQDLLLQTEVPAVDAERRVVARFAEEDQLLASGWLEGASLLAGKPALTVASLGRGRVILFAFRPQYRAQTHATYRMLMNAVLSGAAG